MTLTSECDFCSVELAADVWVYETAGIAAISVGVLGSVAIPLSPEWVACSACSDIIDAGDIPRLTARTLAAYRSRNGAAPEPLASELLAELHRLFAENRRGGRRPYGSEERRGDALRNVRFREQLETELDLLEGGRP